MVSLLFRNEEMAVTDLVEEFRPARLEMESLYPIQTSKQHRPPAVSLALGFDLHD